MKFRRNRLKTDGSQINCCGSYSYYFHKQLRQVFNTMLNSTRPEMLETSKNNIGDFQSYICEVFIAHKISKNPVYYGFKVLDKF